MAKGEIELKGTVHVSEFGSGQMFRSIRFPESVDPNTAKAEYKNGVLRLTATIEKDAAKVDGVTITDSLMKTRI